MIAIVPHAITDTGLGVSIRLAIRDLAVVNGYGDALSVRHVRRGADDGLDRPLDAASVAIGARGFTLLFCPRAVMEPNAFIALVIDHAGRIIWQEDTDHPSYYESYDLARRAFARLHRFERENRRRVMTPSRRTKKDGQ
ncbi:hypothetical protein LMG10733_1324 [Bifidobacterium adolescentis]|uniref:hypothetical protein n=1 Tax=Bifidobacterium adolescentis TaxID=1680 RepID=UPI00006DD5F4|nr:hypothetical protein [Bifidobacterium adolescentis]MCT6790165.1 hypothetical protein [Bifidobacterium adolescentis]NRD15880.1 hypothetical protein [Bifidobacterium adolescentis]OSG97436.1 hypothetical protein LMG10733_1324 [Bifidobacterium adolescentis]SPU23434.1 Uncharacterised protein [Bifidobacterium adolescentis]